jgi:hypothetical protein
VEGLQEQSSLGLRLLKHLPSRASVVPQPSRFARIHPAQQVYDPAFHNREFMPQGAELGIISGALILGR